MEIPPFGQMHTCDELGAALLKEAQTRKIQLIDFSAIIKASNPGAFSQAIEHISQQLELRQFGFYRAESFQLKFLLTKADPSFLKASAQKILMMYSTDAFKPIPLDEFFLESPLVISALWPSWPDIPKEEQSK